MTPCAALMGHDASWIEGAYLRRAARPGPPHAVVAPLVPTTRASSASRRLAKVAAPPHRGIVVVAGGIYDDLRAIRYDAERREWLCADRVGNSVWRTARELGR